MNNDKAQDTIEDEQKMDGQIFGWFTELLRELDLKVVEKACNNAEPGGTPP